MTQTIKNNIQNNIFGLSKNVCSSRTNLGLLLDHEKQTICNRGMGYND